MRVPVMRPEEESSGHGCAFVGQETGVSKVLKWPTSLRHQEPKKTE